MTGTAHIHITTICMGEAVGSTDTDRAVELDGANLDITKLRQIAEDGAPCRISPTALARVAANRKHFEDALSQGVPAYGVTTGYGEMVYMQVDISREIELQTNLVRSHSAGVGPLFSPSEARSIVAARLNALVKGYSGVRPELVERLALYLNEGITPAIPEIGSLGASGDLAPLSHVASTVIGEGYVLQDGRPVPTREVLQQRGIQPLDLRFKEGLALINGTSAMTGVGALVAAHALNQLRQAEIISALGLEVMQGSTSPFQPEGHELARPHRGQIDSAANLLSLLTGSQLAMHHADLRRQAQDSSQSSNGAVRRTDVYLQKAYTMRAVPQVYGAVRDTLYRALDTLDTELNSANDNPLCFEGHEIFHGANFHGQPVAFTMDFLTIALTQLGVFSERRTNRFLNRYLNNGLPEFLVAGEPGLNSGFAGVQYPATALVAENRTIAPASTQSVPSNGDNQDVVSMGLIAARNARRVLRNNYVILAVECLATAQAVDLAGCRDRLSPAGEAAYQMIRSIAPTLDRDRYMADELEQMADALSRHELLQAITGQGLMLR